MPMYQNFKTDGSIIGRNGVFPIQKVQIHDIPNYGVTINGIGKRGTAIRGGLQCSPETMDEIAKSWIKYRKINP